MGASIGPHLSPEELLHYFGQRLDERRQEEVEHHLGACEACAANASAIYLLEPVRRALGGAVDTRISARASLIARMADSVAHVEREWWRRRLEKGLTTLWEELAAALRSAVRIDVGSGGEVLRLQPEAGPAVRVRGEGGRPAHRLVEVTTEESPAGQRRLRVRAEVAESAEAAPRFAFLAPLAPGGEVLPAPLQELPGQGPLSEAIFEDVRAGEYLVILELPAG